MAGVPRNVGHILWLVFLVMFGGCTMRRILVWVHILSRVCTRAAINMAKVYVILCYIILAECVTLWGEPEQAAVSLITGWNMEWNGHCTQ